MNAFCNPIMHLACRTLYLSIYLPWCSHRQRGREEGPGGFYLPEAWYFGDGDTDNPKWFTNGLLSQPSCRFIRVSMLLILYGSNSDICGHLSSNLCYLIYLRHFIRSREVTNRIVTPKILPLIHAWVACSELQSNISTVRVSNKIP